MGGGRGDPADAMGSSMAGGVAGGGEAGGMKAGVGGGGGEVADAGCIFDGCGVPGRDTEEKTCSGILEGPGMFCRGNAVSF